MAEVADAWHHVFRQKNVRALQVQMEDVVRMDVSQAGEDPGANLHRVEHSKRDARAVEDVVDRPVLPLEQQADAGSLAPPRLKGSVGEGPNQTNYSDRSSVRIPPNFRNFR